MILAIDMGNSNIVIGGIDNTGIYFVERVTTNHGKTELEYAVNIKDIMEIHGLPLSSIEGAILSSVVPPLTDVVLSAVPIIVIDMGTATTMSVIDHEGNYTGGIIFPGLRVSLDSLSSRAAQLPYIGLNKPTRVIGKNTIDCMKNGILFGNAAMIDGLIDRMEAELGASACLVATGGLASSVVPLCYHKIYYDDALLLKGLLILYEKNKQD